MATVMVVDDSLFMRNHLSKLLARNGYESILAYYYGGLQPEPGRGLLPDRVRVGLVVERVAIRLIADGPFRLITNGVPGPALPAGDWSFRSTERGILAAPTPILALTLREILGLYVPR